jgi:hypothetical protein
MTGKPIPSTLVLVLGAVVAILVGSLVYGTRLTTDWITIWTGMLVAIGAVTLLIVLAAALIAWRQVDVTLDIARVGLAHEVINSSWATRAVESARPLGAMRNYEAARQRVRSAVALNNAGTPDDEVETFVTENMNAYIYLAQLFNRGVLDANLLIEQSAGSFTFTFYLLYDRLKSYIDMGAFEDSILEFGRASLKRTIRNKEMLVHFPFLKDFHP